MNMMPVSVPAQVVALITAIRVGESVLAIKLFRHLTDASLKEAMDQIRPVMDRTSAQPIIELMKHLQHGRKAEAVKQLSHLTCQYQHDAMEQVEAVMAPAPPSEGSFVIVHPRDQVFDSYAHARHVAECRVTPDEPRFIARLTQTIRVEVKVDRIP